MESKLSFEFCRWCGARIRGSKHLVLKLTEERKGFVHSGKCFTNYLSSKQAGKEFLGVENDLRKVL